METIDEMWDTVLVELAACLPVNPLARGPVLARLELSSAAPFELNKTEAATIPEETAVVSERIRRARERDRAFLSFLQPPKSRRVVERNTTVPIVPMMSFARDDDSTTRLVQSLVPTETEKVEVVLNQHHDSNRIRLEWYHGMGVNELRKRAPVFVQTYELLSYNKTDNSSHLKFDPKQQRTHTLFTQSTSLSSSLAMTCQRQPSPHVTWPDMMHRMRTDDDDRLDDQHCLLWTLYFLFSCLHELRAEFRHYDLYHHVVFVELSIPLHVSFMSRGVPVECRLKYYPVVSGFAQCHLNTKVKGHPVNTDIMIGQYPALSHVFTERTADVAARSLFQCVATLTELGSDLFRHNITERLRKHAWFATPASSTTSASSTSSTTLSSFW